MSDDSTPTLQEIIQLTRSELTSSQQDDDIIECGRACLALLPRDPDACLQVAYQHLHDVPYKEVRRYWRRLYVDAALRVALAVLEEAEGGGAPAQFDRNEVSDDDVDWVTKVVKILDMALILTGVPAREELVELWFTALDGALANEPNDERPAKRRKVPFTTSPSNLTRSQATTKTTTHLPSVFPSTIATPPHLLHPLPRLTNPSLEAFQARTANPSTQHPFIIQGAIEHWPALYERPWRNPSYLLQKTLGGRRLVPVEIGRSYTDDGWGQKILSFREFVGRYMGCESGGSDLDGMTTTSTTGDAANAQQTGYLAQHDLFAQIPSLRADISIPEYCYASPPPTTPPTNPTTNPTTKPVPTLDEPLLNAWFGPAGTISPLHTDPYHNILAQVVGYKYIRLYAPWATEKLYPRGVDENGIDMSNTSAVDLDVAMRTWPGISCWEGNAEDGGAQGRGIQDGEADSADDEEVSTFADQFEKFKEARYVEGVLGPGECLYVPMGWWHYVRSLTPSFSAYKRTSQKLV